MHMRKLSCGGPFFPATSHQSHTSMHPSINHVQVVAYLKYIQHELCELTPSKYNIKFSQSSFTCNADRVENTLLFLNSFSHISNSFLWALCLYPLCTHFVRSRGGATQSEASTRLLKLQLQLCPPKLWS